MSRKRFVERVAFSAGKVGGTAEAPVVEGVLLCGPTSANRRRYLKEAFAGERVKRYNGVPVKVTAKHGDTQALYAEQIGVVANARHRDDGMPVGDILVNPETELARKFLWDAKNNPAACGMSHVAECETKRAADGWDDVTELVEAVSVDVIGAKGAATTKGLFEGKQAVKTTLRAVLEKYRGKLTEARQKAARKLLLAAEDDAALGAMMDAPVDEPAEDAGPEDGIKGAFLQACMHLVEQGLDGEMDPKEVLSKLKELFRSHANVNGDGKGAEEEEEEGYEAESKKRKPKADLFGLLKECRAECGPDFTPSETMLKALAAMPEAADRKALLAEHKAAAKAQPERPQSGRTPPAAAAAPAEVPSDPKKFAEWVSR